MFTEIFHNVGNFIKYLGASAVLILSISLSFAMFASISPADMPWFPWAALGLTDGGFLGWLVVFRMIKYHGAHKSVAFVMIWVCLVAVLFTDAMELAKMFHIAPIFAGMYYYALIALLLGHFLALAIDELISEGQKYQQHLPTQPEPRYRVTEERQQQSQPKEERILERRSTRALPSARSSGPGIWENLKQKWDNRRQSSAQEPKFETQDERDEWLAEIELKRERDMAEAEQRKEAARQRVLARQLEKQDTDELPLSATEEQKAETRRITALPPVKDDGVIEEDDKTSVQQPELDDRKAESERQAKQSKK